jgi:protein-S-isoprenylcysteine O-methyltransferase Ste14
MAQLYSLIALISVMAVPAAFVMGFRYEPNAPWSNYAFDVAAFVVFMAIHFVMLLPGFKKAVYGKPHSTSSERRVYVMVSIVTWILLYYVHRPVPGPALPEMFWVQFLGVCCVFVGFLMFFEGASLGFLLAFMGRPGTELSHSADASTPLMTQGSYASVRHPMYRGAMTYTFASVLIHPHAGQVLFAAMVTLGFLVFIPFEERALIRARGAEYVDYMKVVRFRIVRGVW